MIESDLRDAGAPYDRRAAVFDLLVRSRIYNRVAWSAEPSQYADFALRAFRSGTGPLLEVAAGTAAATAHLHRCGQRPTTLVDRSRPMLEQAERHIDQVAPGSVGAGRTRLLQADMYALPFPAGGFDTILGLGLLHLVEDVPHLVGTLRRFLAPGGRLYLAGLVAETRRGRRYLNLLHRAGEVAAPRSARDLRALVSAPTEFEVVGCMAYLCTA